MRTKAEIESRFAPREELGLVGSVFLVGIGGAGMSGVAEMFRRRGFAVRGTDSTESAVIADLRSSGIEVTIGHTGDPLREGDALILSDAIDLSLSPEVQRAEELGIPLFRRSQALGWLLRDRKCIAITGTHGKTTTTGLVGSGLRAAGMDPTIVVGAIVPEFGSAVIEGEGEWAVIEACEAYDSLRDLDPEIAVLTNLELDHVDFHGTYEALEASVAAFARRAPLGLVYCAEDVNAARLAESLEAEGVRIFAYDASDAPACPELPGAHNRLNAGGALVACRLAGGDPARAWSGIAAFRGAERRLQLIASALSIPGGEIDLIDDYAHHPREIEASLTALRERYPGRRLVVVYQPHLYSRTADLIDAFAPALAHADHVVLTDIYPAREDPIPGVSSARIAEQLGLKVDYVPSRHLLPRFVKGIARGGDVIVAMGAGNIAEFVPAFMRECERTGPLRIAVVLGGDSAEREVSLHSGRAILAALTRLGYDAFALDASETLLAGSELRALTGLMRPDLAFLAVHGTHAEDGSIHGFFNLLHIPATGSGLAASALAMDKAKAKEVLSAAGLDVPTALLVRRGEPTPAWTSSAVVKPNRQGSTVGLSFVESPDDLPVALEKAFRYDDEALVEEWIRGVEISVPVLGDRALPPVEIVPASGRYDFAAKYTPGATDEIVPARLPEEILRRAELHAVAAHRALGCAGATRTDMIVAGDRLVILEVNTLPGMTPTSLLPRSAAAAGMSFDQLCEWMVTDALTRSQR